MRFLLLMYLGLNYGLTVEDILASSEGTTRGLVLWLAAWFEADFMITIKLVINEVSAWSR